MRSFKIALISFILLIGGCILYTWYVHHLSSELILKIDHVHSTIATDTTWSHSEHALANFRTQYQPIEKKLYPLISHEQITQMNTLLDALEQYVSCHDRSNALAYTSMLKFQFINIPQEEYINFGNLF